MADIELYRPATYSGQTMTLRYTRAQELGPWLDLVAARGEVFVQFWLRPGEAAAAFEGGTSRPPIRFRGVEGIFIGRRARLAFFRVGGHRREAPAITHS